MAIDPRLPRFATGTPEPVPSYLVRLVNRLEVVLRDLLTPKVYESGTVTIVAGLTTGTATLRKAASLVVVTGFQGGGDYTSSVGALTVSGTTVSGSRDGILGDLVISFLAFTP